jgi:uncharacterized protein
VRYEFRWNWWNVEHIARHGIARIEAEFVVNRGRAEVIGSGKFIVRGQTDAGRFIQVVYIFSPKDVIFVIHARPMTDREKRRFRRR